MRIQILAAVLILLPTITRAQDDQSATLSIQFPSTGSVFQTGETIPLDLLFSAPDGTWQMSTRGYDRSGRLDIEQFHVSPPGRDPLHYHFESGIYGGFIGGGLSGGDKPLSADPETIHADLNEWVALDKPGRYTLYVTSGRVSRHDGAKVESVALRSNTLNFDIIEASPAWQAQTLGAAAATLGDPAATPEEKRAAARTLRFLDTPDSVREIARQLSIPGEEALWDLQAGVLGSVHLQQAVAAFETQLTAPGAALTPEFLSVFSETKFSADHPPLPRYPDDPQQQEAWRARQQALLEQFADLQDEFYAQAARLAASKTGAARAETVATLLLRPARDSSDIKPFGGLPESEIASAFVALPPRQQLTLLESFWERLRTPAMARAIETVLEQPNRGDEMLRATAFRRLNELDPRAARPYILAEIRRPHADNGHWLAAALVILPDETLPEFDEALATRLEANGPTMSLDARLIGRYATAAILPRVKAVYQKSAGQWACDIEDSLVGYFLRVDPDYGLDRLRAKPTGCLAESLKAMVAAHRWASIEPSIIARLNVADAWAARDAAETLAKYGGPKAQKALWQRLRAFHEQWKDRDADLTIAPNTPRELNDAVALQYGLLASLANAQAWLLDNDQVTELESLALGSERRNAAHWRWHSPIELNLNLLFDGQLQASIGEFVTTGLAPLQAKLAQYPRGTVFHLTTFGNVERLAAATRAIEETAAQNGLVIEDPPAASPVR